MPPTEEGLYDEVAGRRGDAPVDLRRCTVIPPMLSSSRSGSGSVSGESISAVLCNSLLHFARSVKSIGGSGAKLAVNFDARALS